MSLLYLTFVTMLPFLELRAGLPYAIIALNMPWPAAFAYCTAVNFLLAVVLYPALDTIRRTAEILPGMGRAYRLYVKRVQRRSARYVERYGLIGLALFIAVPLPGSGVYSGALAAYILGMKYKNFLTAAALGVLGAGTAVTVIVLSGSQLWGIGAP